MHCIEGFQNVKWEGLKEMIGAGKLKERGNIFAEPLSACLRYDEVFNLLELGQEAALLDIDLGDLGAKYTDTLLYMTFLQSTYRKHNHTSIKNINVTFI